MIGKRLGTRRPSGRYATASAIRRARKVVARSIDVPGWDERKAKAARIGFDDSGVDTSGSEVYTLSVKLACSPYEAEAKFSLNCVEGYMNAEIWYENYGKCLLSAFSNIDDSVLDDVEAGDYSELNRIFSNAMIDFSKAVGRLVSACELIDEAVNEK